MNKEGSNRHNQEPLIYFFKRKNIFSSLPEKIEKKAL